MASNPQKKILSWVDWLNVAGAFASFIGLGWAFFTSPPAASLLCFLGFIVLVIAFVWYTNRVNAGTLVLSALPQLSKKNREQQMRQYFGSPPPPDMNPEQWVAFKIQEARTKLFFAIIFSLFILTGCAIWASVQRAEIQAGLSKIEALRSEVQAREIREREAYMAIARAAGETSLLSRFVASPELESIAERLSKAVAEFEARTKVDSLAKQDQQALRHAKAAAALIKGKFDQVNLLVTDDDIEKLREKANDIKQEEIRALELKSQALLGLHRFVDTVPYLQRLREIAPSADREMQLANCFDAAGDYDRAAGVLNTLIKQHEKSEHGSRHSSNLIATAMANLAGIQADFGDLVNAEATITAAINIFQLLIAREDQAGLVLSISRSYLRRGDIRADMGGTAEALNDYDNAIKGLQGLQLRGAQRLCSDLALAYNNQAVAYVEAGDLKNGEIALRSAMQCTKAAQQGENSMTLQLRAAASLSARGAIFTIEEKQKEAIKEYQEADAILTEVAASSNSRDVQTQVAGVKRALGKLLWHHGDQASATKNLIEARTTYEKLLKQPSPYRIVMEYSDLLIFLASIMTDYARSQKDADPLNQAFLVARRAVNALEVVRRNTRRTQVELLYAKGLTELGMAEFRLGKPADAEPRYRAALEILAAQVPGFRALEMERERLLRRLDLACILQAQAKVTESIEIAEECIERFRSNSSAITQEDLANSLQLYGRFLASANRIEEAKAAMSESVSVFEALSTGNQQLRIAPYLKRSKRHMRELEIGAPLLDAPESTR